MIKKSLLYLFIACLWLPSLAQVRLHQVDPLTNLITIKNWGATTVDISNWWVCGLFSYQQLSALGNCGGSLNLAPGAEVCVSGFSLNPSASDLGLYDTPSFASTTAMQDFTQWGSAGNGRESVAVAKGIWSAGTFISGLGPYYYIGNGAQNGVVFWSRQPPVSCQAGFQWQFGAGGCPEVGFSDLSTASPGTITNWSWDFGDGTGSTQQSPVHNYTANGSYLACLTILTSDSCQSTFCDTVTITCVAGPTCQAAFIQSQPNCPTVNFFDGSTASGTIVGWSWDFGDGIGGSSQQNPSYAYAANGSYVTCLTITTNDSCTSTACDTVTIGCIQPAGCQANFLWQFGAGGCPEVGFSDLSTSSPGTITNWSWDFGDGTGSTQQSPVHNYTANGSYLACLTILTSDSCQSTFCDTVTITCVAGPTCQAAFIQSQPNCPTVNFFDGSTASGTIVGWSWDFGDGIGGSSQQNPSYAYAANGSYVACLTITTNDSCTSTVCDTVTIGCIQPAGCQSNFLWQFGAGGCPEVGFTDLSTSSPGTITNWSWDFGDGGSSTQQSPVHNYIANGSYLACLTIFTSDGCQSTFCDTVTITCVAGPTCQAAFIHSQPNCPQVSFFDGSTASGTIVSWSWNFGDGVGSSTQQNPSYTYTANGSFVACLTITTNDSCTSTVCDTVTIGCIQPAGCQSNFLWQFGAGGCPEVGFTDLSTSSPGTITTWSWDFGDGTSSTQQSPVHNYSANGSYLACLTIFTSDSCQSTFCDTVTITCVSGPTCQAAFIHSQPNCPQVSFFDGSTASGTIVSWSWNFGDGVGSSTQQNPSYTYTANGSFVACLTITTNDSCTSTVCDTVTIGCIQPAGCQSNFLWQFGAGGCPEVGFTDLSTSSPGTITTWSWDFGDGTSSTQQSPVHNYSANGSYLACLTIFTSDSCQSTFCDTVTITCVSGPTCQAAFIHSQPNCPQVSFFDGSTSSGTIVNRFWDFGDGVGSSTQQNPSYTYTANGSYVVCLTISTSDSCSSTVCDTVTIACIQPAGCQANFLWQFGAGGCPEVGFTDLSTSSPGTITGWSWDFGDGTSSTQQNPTHNYTANGAFVTCLTIFTSDSCQSTFCDTVNITCVSGPTCQSAFIHTQPNCPSVSFFDGSTASGTVVSWSWNFGDGTSSALQNPAHTYTANGSYVACLTITTNDSCSSTSCDTVTIGCIQPAGCQANFLWQFGAGGCPEVGFTDLSTSSPGTITGWSWDFGDGTSSTQQSPTHNYTANGAFVTCLTIFTSDSCQSTFCDTVTISCISGPTCQAAFVHSQPNCPSVSFFDGSTASGTVVSWSWNFGDGTSSALQNPSHTYTANGSYIACLTITTNDSCTSTACDTVTISCIQPSGCQANFLWQFGAGGCPEVGFTDLSTSSPGTITGWSWDFGDGTSSTQQSPTHNYTANGAFVTCLTIFTSDSCQSTFCDTVTISCISGPTCQAAFVHSQPNCPSVSFFDGSTASGTVVSWSWNFGDGTSSALQNPTHTYTANGSYVACLTITTNDSCSSTVCDTVTITCITQPTCQAAFQYTLGLCPTVSFFDGSTASGTITGWAWTFGDGGTSAMQNPSHTYAANGNYVVCLSITTNDGCSSTFCDTLNITCITQPTCNAAYQWAFIANGCPSVGFTDFSTASPGTITSWSWTFGDGGTSTLQNPSHTYTANGSYVACLTILTSDSCQSTFCDTVDITCITQPTCQAAFQYTLGACPTISFFDGSTASGTITGWSWTFGDGGTSAMQNPTHTYTANGSYSVCLSITTSDGCSSTWCDTLNITCITQPTCQALFQWTGANDPTIDFFDASTASPGTVTSWSWDFGDGGSSTSQNPSHTYAANGVYTVCLTIMTSDSCTDVYCDTVTVVNVALDEVMAQFDVTVSPNPFSDEVRIQYVLSGVEDVRIEVYDLAGKYIATLKDETQPSGSYKATWRPENVSNGMYLLRFSAGTQTGHAKLLLAR